MMKKVYKFGLLLLIFTISTLNINVYAATNNDNKTLGQLKQELADYKREVANNKQKENLTKSEINQAKNNVSNKQNEITANQQKINDAINESAKLEVEIENGKKELDALVKSYQIAKGDNIYLEYIFEAESYEDLIYRYAVMEQIMNYQEDKIASWKDKIEHNKQLKADLTAREATLNDQIKSLADDIDKLNDELEDYYEISIEYTKIIQTTQENIDNLVKLGCKDNQTLLQCSNVLGDSKLIRPLNRGTITSVWGNRVHPVTGKVNTFHNGVDIGGNKVGTPIYASANGKVGKIIYKASCGGNQVYIYHNINGKRYTTSYLHLNTINVKLGQQVKNSTIIGTVGGQKGTGDGCTTGAHLHFGLGSGWFGSDYITDSKWKSSSINPASIIPFPAKGKYFNTRI